MKYCCPLHLGTQQFVTFCKLRRKFDSFNLVLGEKQQLCVKNCQRRGSFFHICFIFMIMIPLMQRHHFPVREMSVLLPQRPPSNDLPYLFLVKLQATVQRVQELRYYFSCFCGRFSMNPYSQFFLSAYLFPEMQSRDSFIIFLFLAEYSWK